MQAILLISFFILIVAGIALMPLYKEIKKDEKHPPKYDKSKIKKWEDDED